MHATEYCFLTTKKLFLNYLLLLKDNKGRMDHKTHDIPEKTIILGERITANLSGPERYI